MTLQLAGLPSAYSVEANAENGYQILYRIGEWKERAIGPDMMLQKKLVSQLAALCGPLEAVRGGEGKTYMLFKGVGCVERHLVAEDTEPSPSSDPKSGAHLTSFLGRAFPALWCKQARDS